MKPIAIHLSWLAVAAAAFAAGKFLTAPPATPPQSPGPPVLASPTQAPPPSRSADKEAPADRSAIGEIGERVAQFRVSSTGHINAGGMRDAVVAAIRESDPVQSSMMFAMLMEELTPENAEAARDAISETVSGWESFRFLGLLNYKWGAIDGSNAVAAAQNMGGRESFMSTAMVLSGWATNDPEAALTWMESQESNNGMWMRSLVTGLAGSDPERATELVSEMAQDDPRAAQGYTESIARELLKGGIGEAEQWLDSLADPSMRKGAIETISGHLARTDPKQALSWASQLDPGDGQNSGMNKIFSDWSRRDPAAASQTLTSIPDGPSKDYAITGLVSGTLREDPEAAVTWAATIGDDGLRNETIINSGAQWFRRDENAAATWLAGSDLSEELQTAIITKSTEQQDFRFDAFGGGRRGPR